MSRLGTLPRVALRRLIRLVLSVLATGSLALAAAACTSDEPSPPNPDVVTGALADTTPGKAPAPAERCRKSGNTPVAKEVVTTADGVHLAGVRFGTGERGVVLLPQKGADLCPWWDFAQVLVQKGFHVLAIDVRGSGFSEDAAKKDYTADATAAVTHLKTAGAKKVVIMGASQGAAIALVTAAHLGSQVSGVVSLSYPDNALDVTDGAGDAPRTPIEAAAKISVPMLLCFTADDRFAKDAKPQALVDASPSTIKQMVGRPGVSHGWDMLKIGNDDVSQDVLNFLESYA